MNSYTFDFVEITYEDLNMRDAPVRVEAYTQVPAHTHNSGHINIARCRKLHLPDPIVALNRKKNGNWIDSDIQATIQAVDDDMYIRKASLVYKIPHTTLIDWLTRKTRIRKRGREGTLIVEEKRLIVDQICKCQDLRWPLANLDLRLKVVEITQTRPMSFRQVIPGFGWLKWWKHHHSNLTLRMPQGLEIVQACQENVDIFYDNLVTLYSMHNYPL